METLIIAIIILAAVALVVRLVYSTVLGAVLTWIALRQLPKSASEFQNMTLNEQLEVLKKLKDLNKTNQMISYTGALNESQRKELQSMAAQQGIDLGR